MVSYASSGEDTVKQLVVGHPLICFRLNQLPKVVGQKLQIRTSRRLRTRTDKWFGFQWPSREACVG